MGNFRRNFQICLIISFCLLSASALAQSRGEGAGPAGLGPLTTAETWALQQVVAGLPADLQEKFGPDQKGRQLRGRFLEALLTDGFPGVKVHSRGITIKNAVIPDYLDMQSAEVRHAAALQSCHFPIGLNLSYGRFKKALSLEQSRIGGVAFFNGLKVESDISLNEAVFQSGVFFEGADIVGRLQARGLRLEHPDLGGNFANTQVGQDADFQGALLAGNAFFSRMRIKGNFSIFKARFGRTAFFDGLQAAGDLNAIEASFSHPTEPVYLTQVKVGGHALLTNLASPGGVSLALAHCLDLFVGSNTGVPLSYQKLVLDYAVVDRLLDLRNVELGKLEAKKFQGKDLVYLDKVQIKDEAQLQSSNFQNLVLIQVAWPAKKDAVWLDDMTYQNITARDKPQEGGPEDWRKLVALVQQARFNTQNYAQLESFCQRRGDKDRADEVYILGKRRETMQEWWRPSNLAILIFWDGLAGYGKKPSRTLWLSLMIVMLGTLFFDPKNFDPSFLGGWTWLLNGSPTKTAVIRFFLSLDEFLPGVDLGLARLWQISQISFGTLLYYHFHKIAGWILIPVALAAVYTQFK